MSPILLSRHTSESAEWYADRARRLGGSEIATVLNLPGVYSTYFTLWHHKAGHAEPDQGDSNPSTEWGKRLEPVIVAKWLEDHPGWEIVPWTQGTMWIDEEQPWRLASPDAIVWCPATGQIEILECKTCDDTQAWEWEGTVPPLRYVCQLRWYLDILQISRGRVLVLIGGNDYREFTVQADARDAQVMTSAGRRFLDSIEAGDAPPVDGSERTLRLLRFMHPHILPDVVEVDDTLAVEFLDAAADQEWADARFDTAKARLLDLMGDAKTAEHDGVRLAFRMAQNPTMRCVCADGCKLCGFTGVVKTPGLPYLRKDARTIQAWTSGTLTITGHPADNTEGEPQP